MAYSYLPTVERWGVQEIVCPGFSDGNPFTDYQVWGFFSSPMEQVKVQGFYDGNGQYVVRFMPSFEGEYTFRIEGNFHHEAFCGSFVATAPGANVHGPVHVSDTYHFAYADGTRYSPVGTTCYVWYLQSPEIFENTLRTLAASPFNKIRFCVFPKHYDYNHNEPFAYPFEQAAPTDQAGFHWDFARFCPEYFRHLEKAIIRLGQLGIEADIILFHPYDRWGFSRIPRRDEQRYLQYIASRISAYRNVWWSLANEYDLTPDRVPADWELYAQTLQSCDPYRHLMSIHNCGPFYDHTRPWVTHCCMQRQDIYRTTEYVDEWREQYRKPVIVDEMGYEGNIQHGWGNLSGQEITRRFWEAAVRGGYGGHGETFLNEQGILWWSHGDVLHGDSPQRLRFLRNLLEELPGPLMRLPASWDEVCATIEGCTNEAPPLYLYYYSFMQPSFRDYTVPPGTAYQVELIDTWNMTRTDCGIQSGRFRVSMPARSFMAVLMKKVQ